MFATEGKLQLQLLAHIQLLSSQRTERRDFDTVDRVTAAEGDEPEVAMDAGAELCRKAVCCCADTFASASSQRLCSWTAAGVCGPADGG